MAKFFDIRPSTEEPKKDDDKDFMVRLKSNSENSDEQPKHHFDEDEPKNYDKKHDNKHRDHNDELMAQAPSIPRVEEETHHSNHYEKDAKHHEPTVPIITLSDIKPAKKQKIVTSILTVVLVILLALLASQAIIYYNNKKGSSTSNSNSNAGKVVIGDLNTESSATPTATPTATATPTPATTAATPVKANITVKILNGGGVTGAASKVSTLVTNAGFKVSSTGNAKSYTYATTEILYKNALLKSLATELAAALSSYTTSIKEDATTVGTASDILVIVGKK